MKTDDVGFVVTLPGHWRVLTRLQCFLLGFGGFSLGMNLSRLAWNLDVGRPATKMIGPIAGMVVGAGFILQALYFSSQPESFETEEE